MANTQPLLLALQAKAELERRRRAGVSSAGKRFERYRDDPAAYAREVLGIEWWSRQVDIANSIHHNRRTVVYAGHSVGKTMSMGGITQWHFDCWDPSITLTTAPSWSSIHDLLWGEIKSQRPPGAGGRLLDLRLDGGPMHYLAGHNAESGSGFQGRHEARVLIVLDEAMGVPPYIWEATNAMMTSPDCRVIALGNPTETSGEYYDIRENPDWSVITISCLDHPNIAAELAGHPAPFPKAVSLIWVEEMVRNHCTSTSSPPGDAFEFPPKSGEWYEPDDIFRSRVLGLFPRQSAQAIFSEAWLIKARAGGMSWKPRTPPEIGADIARYGDDHTTLYGRRGPVVTDRESYAKQGTMETVGRIIRLADKMAADCAKEGYRIDPKAIEIKVDDTGLGGGVTDRLDELGYSVIGIDFGERAINREEFFNRGSEMWFGAAYRARDMRLDLSRLPDDVYRQLSAELRARRYKIQSDKTLRAESKDDIKKRIGRSPDDADALVLAFAGGGTWKTIEVEKPDRIEVAKMAKAEKTKTDNPFLKQVQDCAPDLFPERDGAEVCGNCTEFKISGGKGRCRLRYLRVDGLDRACDFFEEVEHQEDGGDDEEEEDDG